MHLAEVAPSPQRGGVKARRARQRRQRRARWHRRLLHGWNGQRSEGTHGRRGRRQGGGENAAHGCDNIGQPHK